jgi:2-dehydropantoate 2-reductase
VLAVRSALYGPDLLHEYAGGVVHSSTLPADIKTVRWAKLAFICAQAGLTAAVRLPVGEIRAAPAAWAAFGRLVAEVCAVAEAEGHPVPQAARERALALAQALPGSFSCLHDDLAAGRRMELEARRGLAVPMSEAVYAILQR